MVDVETEVERIEKTERVISTSPSGDGAVLVFTEPKRGSGGVEKR